MEQEMEFRWFDEFCGMLKISILYGVFFQLHVQGFVQEFLSWIGLWQK